MKEHNYKSTVEWTGNKGAGTFDYRSYSRSHIIMIEGKPNLQGSSDSSFRGEKDKHNPEDLFLASLSSCHMLWYLHLCSEAGVIVMKYVDHAIGIMEIRSDGSGQFKNVTLYPKIIISSASNLELAESLHAEAHSKCFIANSCNFKIDCNPNITKS